MFQLYFRVHDPQRLKEISGGLLRVPSDQFPASRLPEGIRRYSRMAGRRQCQGASLSRRFYNGFRMPLADTEIAQRPMGVWRGHCG